jgi:hypothetical protein
LRHCDPYQQKELLHTYQVEGGETASDTAKIRKIETTYMYLPTAFPVTAPFAVFPFIPAQLLWVTCTAGGFIFASVLTWKFSSNHAPLESACLIGFLLATSELLVVLQNPAGITISLCVLSVWCFLSERYIRIGILCLALSLMLKPHDSGLIWLYFLLAGGIHRKRALQTLAVVIMLSAPVLLWVTHVSPHWIQELHSNLAELSMRGGLNDPGPSSAGAHGLGMMISLQTAISVFWDNPQIYNPASYCICGSLLLIWIIATLRAGYSRAGASLAIAAVTTLTMLFTYHRQHDAKLLLLTVPACAMLWAEEGRIGKIALLITATSLVLTGELSYATLLILLPKFHISGQASSVLQVLPIPLILFLTTVFYLWIYLRRTVISISAEPDPSTTLAPVKLLQ